MKTCSLSEAKSSLGRLADEALEGNPTVISRGGKLLILRAYEPPDPEEFDSLIDSGISSSHMPLTSAVWEGIRQRGRKLARQPKKKHEGNRPVEVGIARFSAATLMVPSLAATTREEVIGELAKALGDGGFVEDDPLTLHVYESVCGSEVHGKMGGEKA